MVLARGVPLRNIVNVNQWFRTESEERASRMGASIRNSWEQLGDQTVMVLDTADGPMVLSDWHAGNRLRKIIETVSARMDSQMSVEAEMKAMASLKDRVSESQYRCYVLNGMFPEQSKRSGLFYFFRKGLPTLVLSYHGYPSGRVLAGLCLHPVGYHSCTFAGLMCPTDEVICALLLMRSDEHFLWKKSGQWKASDPRSGI
jgi:hypothetical protein